MCTTRVRGGNFFSIHSVISHIITRRPRPRLRLRGDKLQWGTREEQKLWIPHQVRNDKWTRNDNLH